jgi:HAMP domain-containing protein
MTTADYTRLSQKELNASDNLMTQSDHHQASEKLWGAAALMVKAVAATRGWSHSSHRELYRIISNLAQETGRRELIRLFGSASALHTNFYEDWMPPDHVEELASQVKELVQEPQQTMDA